MIKMQTMQIRLTGKQMKALDAFVKKQKYGFRNRSEAIRGIIYQYLINAGYDL